MKIEIEIFAGREHRRPTKSDIDGNIDALQRAIDNKPPLAIDDILLLDTMSILQQIRDKLPE